MRDPVLSAAERAFVEAARRAVLTTIAPDGRPRPVPICFVLDPRRPVLYTPLDDKPKATDDPMRLARVTDILADPRVVVLVDRWDEDWTGSPGSGSSGRRRCSSPTRIPRSTPTWSPRSAPGTRSTRRTTSRRGRSSGSTIEHTTSWGALDAA